MCGFWEKNTFQRTTGRKAETLCGPLIDWNGNGWIDPEDIAISLAITEEGEMDDEDDEEQE